jgi:hypothetical protein
MKVTLFQQSLDVFCAVLQTFNDQSFFPGRKNDVKRFIRFSPFLTPLNKQDNKFQFKNKTGNIKPLAISKLKVQTNK